MLIFIPWVRCPPAARLSPRKVSPGFISPKKTAALAEAPEWGCTFGELAAEQLRHPVDRQLLSDINELAATIIALSGVAFGIFVGQDRALRFQNRAADDVFRGDQLDFVTLTAEFALDHRRDFRVAFRQASRKTGWRAQRLRRTVPSIASLLSFGTRRLSTSDAAPPSDRFYRCDRAATSSGFPIPIGAFSAWPWQAFADLPREAWTEPHDRDLDAGLGVDGCHLHNRANGA